MSIPPRSGQGSEAVPSISKESLKLQASKTVAKEVFDRVDILNNDPSARIATKIKNDDLTEQFMILNHPTEASEETPQADQKQVFILISREPSSAGIYLVESTDPTSKQLLTDYLDRANNGKNDAGKFRDYKSGSLAGRTTFQLVRDPADSTSTTLNNPVFLAERLPDTPESVSLFIETLQASRTKIEGYHSTISLAQRIGEAIGVAFPDAVQQTSATPQAGPQPQS